MSAANDSVFVTGYGCISAAGNGVEEMWQNTVKGRALVRTRHLARLDRDVSIYPVEKMPAIDPRERRLLRHADRSVLLALCAAKEAWQAAELDHNSVAPDRVGLLLGSSRGPAQANEMVAQPRNPTDSLYTTFSSIAGVVAAVLGIEGCSIMTSATCVSGAAAMQMAMQMIRAGKLDIALAGGVDAPLTDSLLEQFAITGVLAGELGPESLRPFSRDRTGTVLGEGAAVLILESKASVWRRGVRPRGSIRGVALGCDHSFRAGENKGGEGLRQTTIRGMKEMQLNNDDVDLLHLHGTGTRLNDLMESRCVHRQFGPEKEQPHSWATKGITGHTLGASAVFQTILALEVLRESYIPPTTNCTDQDPECRLRLSGGSGVEKRLKNALCLTSGFWGNSSCVGIETQEGG